MPKSNLCEDHFKKRYDYVAGILTGGLRQNCLDNNAVSLKTGIPTRTVTDRLLHPENIKLKDLYKICDVAGVRILFELKEKPD